MPRQIAAALLLAACGAPDLMVTLTPTSDDPALEAVLLAADARWEAAGVDPDRIVIGPGGAPVTLVPGRQCGDAPCAMTHVKGRGSEYTGVGRLGVELYSLDLDVATHELGHALGINVVALDVADHTTGEACDPAAPARPLMCAVVGSVITDEILELACSVGHCTHFTPEG